MSRIGGKVKELRKKEKEKHNFVLPAKNLGFSVDGGEPRLYFDNMKTQNYRLTDWAFGQLCSRLGLSADYMWRCLVANEYLLCKRNVSTWLEKLGERKFLIRTQGGNCRAVLSDRYKVMDNLPVLETVARWFETGRMSAGGLELAGEDCFDEDMDNMYLRLIDRERLIPIHHSDEKLFAGLVIVNSEIGQLSLRITIVVWRQVCSNGLVVPEGKFNRGFNLRHIGNVKQKGFSLQKELEQVFRGIPTFVDHFGETVVRAMETPLDKATIRRSLNALPARRTTGGLGRSEVERILMRLLPRYGNSLWGWVNALTEYARTLRPPERLRVESIAGEIMGGLSDAV